VLANRNQQAVRLQRRGQRLPRFQSQANGGGRAPLEQRDFGRARLVLLQKPKGQQQAGFICAHAGAIEPVDIETSQSRRSDYSTQSIETPGAPLADAGGLKRLPPVGIGVLPVAMSEKPQPQG